jgi:hypothetical protein
LRNCTHLTAGVKITDRMAVDPKDGSLLSSLDDEFGMTFNVQSRNYCFAAKSLLGKDTKDSYSKFTFYIFFWMDAERELISPRARSKDHANCSVEPVRLK